MAYRRRERVFCISIRKDIDAGFKFPSPVRLEKRLIDVLEPPEAIDQKYYLSSKLIQYFDNRNEHNKQCNLGFRFEPIERERAELAKTVTTKAGSRDVDNFIIEGNRIDDV